MRSKVLVDFFFDLRRNLAFRNMTWLAVVFFIASSFEKSIDRELKAKQANILIRQIGNRLLLQSGDSSSRVLPVRETKEGVFQLSFEKKFLFYPDSLIALAKELLPQAKFASGYIVTVHDCLKGGIVYGFLVNHSSPDVLACKGRSQPAGCYSIEFSFPDFYENTSSEMTGIDRPLGSTNLDAGDKALSSPVEDENMIGATDHQKSGALSKISTDPNASGVDASTGKSSASGSDHSVYLISAILLLAGIGFLFLRARKNRKVSTTGDKEEAKERDRHQYQQGNKHQGKDQDLRDHYHQKDQYQKNQHQKDYQNKEQVLNHHPGNQDHAQHQGNDQAHTQHPGNDQAHAQHPGIDRYAAQSPGVNQYQDHPQYQYQYQLPSHDRTKTTPQIPELPSLGKYLFNLKGQYLLLGTEMITLTDKECRVLELLHKNFGELITRDTLMQEIWINEGVITGRSLDMFVSKLRKKLSGDADLKISNVHGKGYRLESA